MRPLEHPRRWRAFCSGALLLWLGLLGMEAGASAHVSRVAGLVPSVGQGGRIGRRGAARSGRFTAGRTDRPGGRLGGLPVPLEARRAQRRLRDKPSIGAASRPVGAQAGRARGSAAAVPALGGAHADPQHLGHALGWRVGKVVEDRLPNWQDRGRMADAVELDLHRRVHPLDLN